MPNQPCRITSTSPSLTMYSFPSSFSSPFSLTPGYPPCSIERLPVHHLGANEFLLEIAVNRARGFDGAAVHRDGPGAHLGFSGRQETHQPQQRIGRRNQAFQARFRNP